MSELTEKTFKNNIAFTFLGKSPLLGLSISKMQAKCSDDEWRPLTVVELGFFFFKFSYHNIKW